MIFTSFTTLENMLIDFKFLSSFTRGLTFLAIIQRFFKKQGMLSQFAFARQRYLDGPSLAMRGGGRRGRRGRGGKPTASPLADGVLSYNQRRKRNGPRNSPSITMARTAAWTHMMERPWGEIVAQLFRSILFGQV